MAFSKLTLLKIEKNSFNLKVTEQSTKIKFKFCNLFPHLFELYHVT